MIIVQEMQTNGGVTAMLPPRLFADRLEADSAYFVCLSAAAISKVNIHTVVMYDEVGNFIRKEYYEHPTAPPEPEVNYVTTDGD